MNKESNTKSLTKVHAAVGTTGVKTNTVQAALEANHDLPTLRCYVEEVTATKALSLRKPGLWKATTTDTRRF